MCGCEAEGPVGRTRQLECSGLSQPPRSPRAHPQPVLFFSQNRGTRCDHLTNTSVPGTRDALSGSACPEDRGALCAMSPKPSARGLWGCRGRTECRAAVPPRRYPTGGARDMHPLPCHHPLSSGLSTEASQEHGRGQGARGAETLPRPTVSSSPPHPSDGETEAQRRKPPGGVRAELAAAPTNTQSLLGQPWFKHVVSISCALIGQWLV